MKTLDHICGAQSRYGRLLFPLQALETSEVKPRQESLYTDTKVKVLVFEDLVCDKFSFFTSLIYPLVLRG